MKRTFVVPADKEPIYDKFKEIVPEISSKLVEFMEEYVSRNEAVSLGMAEQTIYKGKESDNIYVGQAFKFFGVKIAEGDLHRQLKKMVYLTRKHKFIVASIFLDDRVTTYDFLEPFEDYFEMVEKAKLNKQIVMQCEAYLNRNSVLRTYELLDV